MKKGSLALKEIFSGIKKQGISLRRRFALCLITCLISVIAILFCCLSIFGQMNPTNNELEYALSQQLNYSVDRIGHEFDELAAYAVEFSHELTEKLELCKTSFDGLKNNKDALYSLQEDVYDTVYNNLRFADCSGAFFMLDTTVNDKADDKYYSTLYLKYANVGSDTMLKNSICMFRGAAGIARQHNINLFSTWEYETRQGTFDMAEAVFGTKRKGSPKDYFLTPAYKLPDAWEKVRLLCVPVLDGGGKTVGVCGFEISDPFFDHMYQASDSEQKLMTVALLDEDGGTYTGQIAPNKSGYAPTLQNKISIEQNNGNASITDGKILLTGKTEVISIGTTMHTVAVMLPKQYYNECIKKGQIKTVLLFVAVAVVAILVSIFLSRRYVRPLLRSLEQVKFKQFDRETSIPEINDLFAFLAEQDRLTEEALNRAEQEREEALTSIELIKDRYDELNRQAERLAYSRREEVDPLDYENFKRGIQTLTEKEREIFSLYIQGKTVKEIIDILCVQESTVRFHNKNIYSKLGVHSLKQLLRYAAIMEKESEE